MKEDILEFFTTLELITNAEINIIHLSPIKIKENSNYYASAIKITNNNEIQILIRQIKEYDNGIPTDTIENEIWLDINLIAQEIVRITFNEIRNQFYKTNTFQIFHVEYITNEDKTNTIQENTYLFRDKHTACKELLRIRKHSNMFKTKHIIQNNSNNKEETTMTDEEFAEMPLN